MKLAFRHCWDLSPKRAMALQERLVRRLSVGRRGVCPFKIRDVETVAGADVSYSRNTNTCYAAVVVFRFPEMEILEQRTAVQEASYPYIPGLLTFREAPPVIRALSKVRTDPDLLVFDGQGMAHPRGIGLASHMGLIYDKPSIGLAKSILAGRHDPPGTEAGDASLLKYKDRPVGYVLRSKTNCKPVIVSPGHLMDLEWSRRFVIRCLGKYRIPEITRYPHLLSNRIRRGHED